MPPGLSPLSFPGFLAAEDLFACVCVTSTGALCSSGVLLGVTLSHCLLQGHCPPRVPKDPGPGGAQEHWACPCLSAPCNTSAVLCHPQPGSLVSFKAPGWGGFPGHPPWLVESPDPWAEGHTPGKPQMPHHGRFKPLSSQDHEAHGLGVWQLCGRCLPRTQEPCWIPLGQEAPPCPSINGFPGSGKQAAGSLCPVPSTSALQLPTKTG